MGEYLTPVKRITIPVYGSVDTTGLEPIIHVKEFQHTFHTKQLGFSEFVFPGARHTRGEHLLGALAQCREYTRPLVRKGLMTPAEARNCELAALLHDVGHGPYSHVLENVLKTYGSTFKDHKERTARLIETVFAGPIAADGSSPEDVLLIVQKRVPLSKIISHKTIGADKVAYVRVDQHHTGFPPSPLNIGDLPENIMYLNGQLGTDERMMPRLMEMQRYYFSMYSEVYLRKQTRAIERIFERAVQEAIEAGDLQPDEVWPMSDDQLVGRLCSIRGMEDRIAKMFTGNREMLRAAVVLRMPGHEQKEIVRGKSLVFEPLLQEKAAQFFKTYADPKTVHAAEKEIAQLLNIPLTDIVFTCVDDPARLIPEDVQIFEPTGIPAGTLFDRYPKHASSLEELAQSVTACRVMVASQHRERTAQAAKEICEILYKPLAA